MNKSVEIQAKTIEAAIEEALAELNASYDEVEVDIIQEAGFLKKAKVKVTLKKEIPDETIETFSKKTSSKVPLLEKGVDAPADGVFESPEKPKPAKKKVAE